MITEPGKANYFKHSWAGYTCTAKEFVTAEEMKKSFWREEFCATMARHSDMQKISQQRNFPIEYDGFKFYLHVRCKWDLYAKKLLNIPGDIKSTACTTQKQFEE